MSSLNRVLIGLPERYRKAQRYAAELEEERFELCDTLRLVRTHMEHPEKTGLTDAEVLHQIDKVLGDA